MNKKEFAAKRREGRIIGFQAIYSYEFEQKKIEELIKFEWLPEDTASDAVDYAKKLVVGTIKNLKTIDEIIKSKLINWDFNRISLVDKSILRFSVFSLLYDEDKIPDKVIINEAVEIVKQFGSEESYKFVNGILDAIKKSKRPG